MSLSYVTILLAMSRIQSGRLEADCLELRVQARKVTGQVGDVNSNLQYLMIFCDS